MRNTGYLKAETGTAGDEVITPRYAVEPIVKHLKEAGFKRIWRPFDLEHSFFVRVLEREGFSVVCSHISQGEAGDFFKHKFYGYDRPDCIVSNPPFSLKDDILARLYEIDIPFMILLPQNALQSKVRTGMFMEHGLQYLGFDNRVHFYTRGVVKEINKTQIKPGAMISIEKLGERTDVVERRETDEEMYSKIKLQCHFASAYFCKGVLKKDLMFEHLEVIQEPYFNEEEKEKWMA